VGIRRLTRKGRRRSIGRLGRRMSMVGRTVRTRTGIMERTRRTWMIERIRRMGRMGIIERTGNKKDRG
jgi:hypothetical protein